MCKRVQVPHRYVKIVAFPLENTLVVLQVIILFLFWIHLLIFWHWGAVVFSGVTFLVVWNLSGVEDTRGYKIVHANLLVGTLLHVTIEVTGDVFDDHSEYLNLSFCSVKQPTENFFGVFIDHALDCSGLFRNLFIWVLRIVFKDVLFRYNFKLLFCFVDQNIMKVSLNFLIRL